MSHHHNNHPPKTFDSHFQANPGHGVPYGVLRGKVVDFGAEPDTKTPHFQIIVQDEVPQIWRAAVNVRSDDGSADQAIVVDPLENHPIVQQLDSIANGYTALPDHKPGFTLDFVRQPLFDPADLQALPPFGSNKPGLEDTLTDLAKQAKANGIDLYVWGARFDVNNKPVAADKKFGDKVGIHDIHMNQGNPPPHQRDNGIYQDGGLIFRFADRCVGVFMKFQSQEGRDDAGNVFIPKGQPPQN